MRRRLSAVVAGLVLSSVCLVADDLSVVVDPRADLSLFKTFVVRKGKIDSPRPELDNPLFVKKLTSVIRAALAAKGLTESTDRPDLVVGYTVTGEDVSMGAPSAARGLGPQPVRFTEGTLVIDLTRPGDGASVWRGVYRDDEKTGSKLMQNLPEDAKKLVARYPQRAK